MGNTSRNFYARKVEVFSVESFRGGKAHDPVWAFTYGDREVDGDRYCMASLHAATDTSVVTVALGVALSELSEPVADDAVAESIISDTTLLQPLFERARSTARAALGIIDKVQDLGDMPELDIASDEEREVQREEYRRRRKADRAEADKQEDG
ncbi:hypothetical protein [Nesterenkonia sphaerica]|uniref:Uncharacterized protein n=1 Tax=Nesterenkonia sphaerica TaxID=1804988 RepID=A0A5R9A2M4_9MICC|nr:hypothetical protein [Nesterenkonia sphaerica]TLP72949.1 hypothetical protein FEF27_11005 [Nesterenkonia sphaerica]